MAEVVLLDNNHTAVKYLAERDKRLKKVFDLVGPFTYKPYEDGYSFLVFQIIGQMLANKIAKVMRERLVSLCNSDISPNSIDALSDEQIKSIGISQKKVSYIRALTERTKSDSSFFTSLQNLEDRQVMKKLMDVPGIGKWTAKMYLIFVLNRQDVLPVEDYAFIQAFEWVYKKSFTSKEIEAKCKKWKPYSSIAARYMYKIVDCGLLKTEFHLFK